MSAAPLIFEPDHHIARRQWRARVRGRLAVALALSLNFHGYLMLLELGAPGFSLLDLLWPQAERRVETPRLDARLADVARPLAPVAGPLVVLPHVPPPVVEPEPQAVTPPPVAVRPPRVARAQPPAAPVSVPQRVTPVPAPAGEVQAREPEPPVQPQTELLAQDAPQPETFSVPAARPVEPEPQRAPEIASKKQAEEPPPAALEAEQAEAKRAAEAERRREQEAEARRSAEIEKRKEEESRRLALELEARQRALAQQKEQEAEARRRAEAEKRKEEEARRIALEAEALKRAEEAAREQAAARRKEQEADARRQAEGERQKQEAAAAAAAAAPGAPSGRELAAKALEQARALPAPPAGLAPPRAPGSGDGPRRRAIMSVERDVVLRMYVESWRAKIERNGPFNYRASAGWRARDNPVVTVAIRSDGSLEDVVIHRSSGLREIDEAVRRIARMYAPYSAFPPDIARRYDVIEIRRVWIFEDTLRILEDI